MTMLEKYNQARHALAVASSVDELKAIRGTAEGMAAAARVAGNTEMEAQARELRLRAERKLGQLMKAQRETVGLAKAGRPKIGTHGDPIRSDTRPTLAEAGIDKHLADKSRKAANLPDAEFEVYAHTGKLPPRKISDAAKKAKKVDNDRRHAKEKVLMKLFAHVPIEQLKADIVEERKAQQERNAHAKAMREAEVKAITAGLNGLQKYVGASSNLIELAKKIVQTGYHALSRKAHPDTGGTAGDQTALNKANEFLLDLIANPVLTVKG